MDPANRRAVYAALAANAGVTLAKLVGFLFTGASSMLAETVHSLADTGNQALLLLGSSSASREPSEAHPFGYGRERYFWSFVVALVLFALGSVFAIYEGVHKWMHPEPLQAPVWAVGILVGGLVLEGLSFRTAVRAARPHKGSRSWWTYVRQTKNPELSVVLLEDFGALLGLALALFGVSLAWGTGDVRFDAGGSVLIGLLLGAIAAVLAIEMKSLIIGESASDRDRQTIQDVIQGAPPVRRLINLRTQHLGPDQLLVGAKVEFDGRLRFEELTEAIDVVEAAIREAMPIARIIYIEPDIYDDGER
jgi:cation diffusion facilitator family transporter